MLHEAIEMNLDKYSYRIYSHKCSPKLVLTNLENVAFIYPMTRSLIYFHQALQFRIID